MEIAVATVKQNKDSAVKQRIQDIQMLISWREIAHTYFGKSASWLYHKLDGINEKGLCVADLVAGDTIKTAQERGNLSVTTTTAIRLLLDKAATTQEAVQMLSSWDMHSSINWAHHLAISDASGESVVIEWVNNEMQVIPSVAVTNHYLSPLRENVGVGNTFLRSAPFLPAVFRAWAYSSIITNEANKPSLVLALAVKHCMRLSRPRSLKVIFSRLTLKCFSLGSISSMMFRISSKQIFA